MGTLNFAGGAALSGSGTNLTSASGLDFYSWVDAPVGTINRAHIILDMVLMLELQYIINILVNYYVNGTDKQDLYCKIF